MVSLGRDNGCIGCFPAEDQGLGIPYTSNPYDEEQSVDVLAQELNRISIKEREAVYEEVHGVAGLSTESPEKLAEIKKSLEQELQRIKKKSAYDRALFLSPRHVNDPAFRLMFLRSTRFDPVKAAAKMAAYFESKLELFGEEKLVKRITLNDLDDETHAELTNGLIQFLPMRDRSNRAISVAIPRVVSKAWKPVIRAAWYAIMAELEKEESQVHGFVNVFYTLDTGSASHSDFLPLTNKLHMVAQEVLPYRNVAVHFCYDNAAFRPALRMLALVASKQTRLHFRTHFGSLLECKYALSAFGIPIDHLPIAADGRLTNEVIHDFVRQRREIEEEYRMECENRIDYPSMRDIVLGRGRPYQEFPGNQMLAQLIDDRKLEYQAADRFKKTCISIEIAKEIEETGARFLTRDKETGGWVKAEDNVIREKISGGFRTKKKFPQKSPVGFPPLPDQNASSAENYNVLPDQNTSYPNVRRAFENLFDLGQHRRKRQKQENGEWEHSSACSYQEEY